MSAEDMDVPGMEANAGIDATINIFDGAVARAPATTPARLHYGAHRGDP
jgi:hypothetical protein